MGLKELHEWFIAKEGGVVKAAKTVGINFLSVNWRAAVEAELRKVLATVSECGQSLTCLDSMLASEESL